MSFIYPDGRANFPVQELYLSLVFYYPTLPAYKSVVDKILQGLDISLPVLCGVRHGSQPPCHLLSILQSEDSKMYPACIKGYRDDQKRVFGKLQSAMQT